MAILNLLTKETKKLIVMVIQYLFKKKLRNWIMVDIKNPVINDESVSDIAAYVALAVFKYSST